MYQPVHINEYKQFRGLGYIQTHLRDTSRAHCKLVVFHDKSFLHNNFYLGFKCSPSKNTIVKIRNLVLLKENKRSSDLTLFTF